MPHRRDRYAVPADAHAIQWRGDAWFAKVAIVARSVC